jgi:YHS domain-containing protein
MTVRAEESSHPFEHKGITYFFCCVGCRSAFERDPAVHLIAQEA